MTERTAALFKEFISEGLMSYPMYSHQYRMLRQSLEGKDCIITSGTGSGKTEVYHVCFDDLFDPVIGVGVRQIDHCSGEGSYRLW